MQQGRLTRESAAVVDDILAAAASGPAHPTIGERRAALDYMAEHYGPAEAAVASVQDHVVEGPGGALTVRVYHPLVQRPGAHVIVQFHGGGWALGGPDTYARQSRAICAAAETVLIDVDYRLAPEHPYPAALEDCAAAVQWTLDYARTLGLNGKQVVIAGDSAGGYLAALYCQLFPEHVAGQILIYPVLTVGRDHDLASRTLLGSGEYFLTFDAITNAEAEFFTDQTEAAARPSPLLTPPETLQMLPPTLLILAGLDPLVDEGIAYGKALSRAGVDVTTLVESGTIHAFILFAGAISAGQRYYEEIGLFVRALD